MAVVSGTTDSYNLVGKAEDVENAIFDISPTETPALTLAGRKKATAKLHQWQTDSLAAAASNKQIEGDDASFTTATPTTLLANYTQISRKTVIVSRSADTIRKYGRAKELARLVTKYGKELKRDIEFQIVSSAASSAGGNATAAASAGMGAMIVNRVFAGTATNTTGTVPGYAGGVWSAPTSGTAGTFVEDNLKDALEAAWTDGGDASVILTNSKNKKRMAAFAGASAFDGFSVTNGRQVQGAVIGGVDLYVSDYGSHKVVLDRYMAQSVIYAVDPEYVSVAWLDPIMLEDLAKTGDAEKKMMVCEWTLVLENPDAHAQIRDAIAT